jgi:hypothetical protein
MGHIVKQGGGAIFVWGCMTSLGMGSIYKIEGEMANTLCLSILQDGVLTTIDFIPLQPFSCHILA